MIITKEQQEAWVSNYVKEKHTQDECIGFIDGFEKALDVVNKNFDLALVSERSEQFYCSSEEGNKTKCESQCLGCAGLEEQAKQ
jgi:hypothetical protein